jgi:hypothetical protein
VRRRNGYSLTDVRGGESRPLTFMKAYKTFLVEDGRYYVNGKRVSKKVFTSRRLTECFHQWRPIGCSDKDGYCADCGLMVVGGKKVLSYDQKTTTA